MSPRAVYQRRTVTCLATLTESDCTVVLQQKCDNATLIIFISTTTTTTTRDMTKAWTRVLMESVSRDLDLDDIV